MANTISVSIYCLLWFWLYWFEKVAKFFDLSNTKHNKRFYQYIRCLSCGMQGQTGKNISRSLGFGGKVTAFLWIMQIIFGFFFFFSGKNGAKNLEKCCRYQKKGVILRAKVYLGYKNGQIIRTIINENALFRTHIFQKWFKYSFNIIHKKKQRWKQL